jgi:hypothetical protein
MGMLRWLLGGLVGGAAGVLIWVLIGYTTHYEVGWIAWGVGFLVGLGVRFAAHLGDQEESMGQGIVAAGMAIGSIFLAKFLIYWLLVGSVDTDPIRELVGEIRFDNEAMVASLADEVAEEMVQRGQTVQWPAGMTLEDASQKADYPPEVWRQAEMRWSQLGPDEQGKRTRARMELAMMLSGAANKPEFGEFFSPWDLLWFGLAMVTAYRIGVGSYGNDD